MDAARTETREAFPCRVETSVYTFARRKCTCSYSGTNHWSWVPTRVGACETHRTFTNIDLGNQTDTITIARQCIVPWKKRTTGSCQRSSRRIVLYPLVPRRRVGALGSHEPADDLNSRADPDRPPCATAVTASLSFGLRGNNAFGAAECTSCLQRAIRSSRVHSPLLSIQLQRPALQALQRGLANAGRALVVETRTRCFLGIALCYTCWSIQRKACKFARTV
jgi:hypothetical protein